jgi:hypothetical protein
VNLNELILTHKGTRSYDDLERACGKALTSQRLQQIATTTPKEFPKAGNIRAIAQALGVKEAVVVLAAAESLGLDVARELPRIVQVLPAAASDLSDDEVAAIVHVIRAFKQKELMGNAEHPAAKTKPGSGPGDEEGKKVLDAIRRGGGPADKKEAVSGDQSA